jgi:hypothetical protein
VEDELNTVRALCSHAARAHSQAVGRTIARSPGAALGVFAAGALASVAIALLIMKLSDPAHTGFWRGAHQLFIGKIDNPARATELLGISLYPLCAVLLAMSWQMARYIWRWKNRSRKRAGLAVE